MQTFGVFIYAFFYAASSVGENLTEVTLTGRTQRSRRVSELALFKATPVHPLVAVL